jgi:hypothetical protein
MKALWKLPRHVAVLLAAALAACAGPVEENAPAGEPVEQAPLPAPSTIVGEWRVAGIDGEPLDADFGIGLSVTSDRIGFNRCFAWSYEYAGGRIATQRVDADPSTHSRGNALPPPPPPLTCMTEEFQALAAALDAVTEVDRTPENGVRLSGGGHSVLLFSQ